MISLNSISDFCDAPYRLCSRTHHANDTILDINGVKIGGGNFAIIAGPCAVESEQQLLEISDKVKQSGAALFRAGAFKARTSPYSFQGFGKEALSIIKRIKTAIGMPIISEITSPEQLQFFDDIDIIQVGTRNMYNYELLKVLGTIKKPVLLKRGMSATLTEFLLSAEYIMSGGNSNIILCERGIRTFEPSTRFTLDISAVPMLKKLTHLPVIVDPSHASGLSDLISPLSLASVAAGADGLMIEVHNNPDHALSDGIQAITPDQFDSLCKKIAAIRQSISQE